jgi:5-methylcytosine-specific restriction endonuclease McrA
MNWHGRDSANGNQESRPKDTAAGKDGAFGATDSQDSEATGEVGAVPVRLCRRCSRIVEDGRYFHEECRKDYEREKSRQRRAAKGTTSERGYGITHQRLRKIAIAQHPWCVDCGTTADLCADHIVPTSRGGKNVLSNYAVRCRSCNNARMSRDRKKERL